MAYKVFLAPTGSGNVVFEGDVLNGYTSPDGQKCVIKFYSNDRGYTAAAFHVDAAGAKALRDELYVLVEEHSDNTGKYKYGSEFQHFTLTREMVGTPLILGVIGTDPMFGNCFHRGDLAAMRKIIAEFDTVLKTIAEVLAGKGPTT